ncbi:MAG: DUF1642 domain-containing protein [Lacticaseibacillus paracasei]
MSEEKLYAVKNDVGEWADPSHVFGPGAWAQPSKEESELAAKSYGGNVVTLIEEPKKVVLTKEQAKIVEDAHLYMWPAKYITENAGSGYESERLLMNAYVIGYTVAKEKKYRVITPKSWWESENEPEYMHMNVLNGIENYKGADDDTLFTQKQLDLYELNGAPFTKEEVTDDEQ